MPNRLRGVERKKRGYVRLEDEIVNSEGFAMSCEQVELPSASDNASLPGHRGEGRIDVIQDVIMLMPVGDPVSESAFRETGSRQALESIVMMQED